MRTSGCLLSCGAGFSGPGAADLNLGADPAADSAAYRQGTLWLSPDQLTEMIADLIAVLRDRVASRAAPGRASRLLRTTLFPTGATAGRNGPGESPA